MEGGFEGGFLSCTVMIENLADTGGVLFKLFFRHKFFKGFFNICSNWIQFSELNIFPGGTLKKVTHRNATLQLGRNEFRDVMLRLEAGKKSQRYSVKEVKNSFTTKVNNRELGELYS